MKRPAEAHGSHAQPRAGKVFSDAPFSLAWLRAFDAEIRLKIRRLVKGEFVVADAAGKMTLWDGALSMSSLHGTLCDADVNGDVTIEAAHTPPTMQARLMAHQIDVGRLFNAVAGLGELGDRENSCLKISGGSAGDGAVSESRK